MNTVKSLALFMTTVLLLSIFASGLLIRLARSESAMVGYWKFDEGSGSFAVDDSGNGNTGRVNGSTWVAENNSMLAWSLNFDGADDNVRVEDSPSLHLSSAVTVMAWVYLPTGGHYNDSCVVDKDASNSGTNLALVIHDDSGHVGFGLGYGGGFTGLVIVSSGTVPRDTWTHIAATYNGNFTSIYINGNLDSSASWTSGFNTDNGMPLCIGSKNYLGGEGGGPPYQRWLNGRIDEVQLYNTALSQPDIQADMYGNPIKSSTSVVCSPNPASVTSPVQCTATVAYNDNMTGSRGNVTWSTTSIGGSFTQPVQPLPWNGTCSTTYIDNFTGSVTISASYSGDVADTPSCGSFTLTVTSGGTVYYSKNYTSVQAAVAAATSGSTVIVASGFYSGYLSLNKRLTIIGEKDAPVFGGGGSGIYLTLWPGASGTIVTGIEITNYDAAILIVNASYCMVYNNIMSSMTSGGIALTGSDATSNLIFNNAFQDVPTPINLTASATGDIIYNNVISSQATLTLNIGASGNSVAGNSISASQIILNVTTGTNNVIYNNNFVATSQITTLTAGANTWDAGYPLGGNYWSDYLTKYPSAVEIDHSGLWNTPYVMNSYNKDNYPLMKPWAPIPGHNIAVTGVTANKNVIGKGFCASVTMNVANKGQFSESVSLVTYANTTVIDARQANNLGAASQATLAFTWDTTGLAYGNYIISAWAWPVPSETQTSDNNFTLGVIRVTIPGDIDGDGYVFLGDLGLMAVAWTSTPTSPNWNPNADITGEGQVFLSSLGVMAQHWTESCPSP